MTLQGFSQDAARFRDIDDAVLLKLRKASVLQAVRNTSHMEECNVWCIVCEETAKVIASATTAELDEAAAVVRGERDAHTL